MPCSALSSNSELFHAGPWPGIGPGGEQAAGLPQMDEQPVALEMATRSPELGHQTAVAGFSAAGARAGELKKRLELGFFNVVCDKPGLLATCATE